ncbi:MAG: carboxypeptidase regulatory-like domain-containing protein [Terriglobales bacterium]
MLTAQVSRGSISGTVADKSGAVVPDAQVTATSITTGQTLTTMTDRAGAYRLPLLPVGTYKVEIRKSGFRPLVQSSVSVLTGVDAAMGALTLQVGEVAEAIEVSAATPLVQTAESQVSENFTGTQLYIPGTADNGGLDNLALFVPGVTASRDLGFSNTNGGTGFAVNGLRGRNNDQQIDGQNNNDNSVGGPSLFLSNPEFVDQYQITTNQFKSEYGRNSGSVVNIITKSGTNNWHGSVFGSESNSALNSLTNVQKEFTDPPLTKVPQFNNYFAGGTIGGPIIKNKLFVFGGIDTERLTQNRLYTTSLLTPTPTGLTQLALCFPNSPTIAILQKFGPYGITGGNPLPNFTEDSGPQDVGSCPGVEMAGVQRRLATDSNTWDWLVRVDLLATSADHLSMRYVYNKQTPLNQNSFGSSFAPAGYPNDVPSLSQAAVVGWTRTISPRMVNELRVGYNRLNVQFGGNGIGNTVPPQGDIGNALARIAFVDQTLLGFGPATNAPQGRIVNTWQVQDNWSYTVGRHQLKAGVNFTYQRSPNIFLPNFNGSFTYQDWAAFALNSPTTTSITLGTPSLDFREYDTFVYVGDDFKLRPDLTLNLGVTWSYYGQPANLFNDLGVERESGPNPFFNPALPLEQRVFPRLDAPKNSWGPSVGFAYAPSWLGNKMTVRGGYRLSYDPPFYNIYLNVASSAPQVLAQTIRGVGTAPGLPAGGTGPAVRAALAPFLTLGVADPRSFNQTTVAPDFGPDRVHSWSFGIQQELSPRAAVEVRYVGNHGERLFQSINGNPFIAHLARDFPNLVPSGLTPCPADQATVPNVRPGLPSPAIGRVNCNLGIIRERTNTGSSSYNGLQTEFRTNRLWNQLTMRTSYTFSKTIDNVSEIFGTFSAGGTTAFSQNPLDFRRAEFARSGLDIPHTWTLTFTEEIPFFRNQEGVIGHIVGGWAVSASYILASGQPYTPVQFFAAGATGSGNYYDAALMGAFNSTAENSRPFISNPSAPPTSVGIFGADACAYLGLEACTVAATQLFDFKAVNTTGDLVPVSNDQVRFIINGAQSAAIFGTPFAPGVRNSLRTSKANYGNVSIAKTFKITEGMNLRWHMTMLNVFNHSNYGVGSGVSIDPFVEDLGSRGEETGFADPTVVNNSPSSTPSRGRRQIMFGLRFQF